MRNNINLSHIDTERESLYTDLEKKPTHEILQDMYTEDAKVSLDVEKALPQIESLVDVMVDKVKN